MKDSNKKYESILAANGIRDEISKVEIISPENLVGEHMASICEYVTVYFKEMKKPHHLFLKRKIVIPVPEQDAVFSKIMVNEGKFLTSFVSEMANLCDNKLGMDNNVGIRELFPKTYFADENEIIMENVVTNHNYFMLNKKELQSFEMAKLVMEGLAKLHGTSYCLIQQSGGSKTYLEENPNFTEAMFAPEMADMISKMFEPTYESILKMMEDENSKIVSDALCKLNLYKGKLSATFLESLNHPSIFEVVNHGDCWNNNMMFSTETRTKPELVKLMFVDLQMARLASPCTDIGYYIFTSVKPEARARSRELLKIYFDSMCDLVQKLGHDFPFIFKEFLVDYAIKSKLGLFFGIVMTIGVEAFKSYDTNKSGGNMEEEFNELMSAWIRDNPNKVGEIIEDTTLKVKDFEIFGKL